MSDINNKTNESFIAKKVKPRYINIRENIFQALSNDALAVYMALRFEADYSSEMSHIDKNIQFLCNKAKIKKTRCKECLSELEKNGLIKREFNPGYQSTYWVADELHYFKIEEHSNEQENNQDKSPENEIDQPGRQTTDPGRQTTDINNNLSTNPSHINPIVDFKKSTNHKEDDIFMIFYGNYPNKQKPSFAHKAFYKAFKEMEGFETIEQFACYLADDVSKRISTVWKGRHKSKIPHPSTYLNNKEWEGEIYNSETGDFRSKGNKKYSLADVMGA